MTIALSQVRDMDCVVSMAPLAFDQPSPYREAVGVQAILRRVLYRWAPFVLDLDGWRPSGKDLRNLKSDLEREARLAGDGDFITGASVDIAYEDTTGHTSITGRISLEDGNTYALEVAAGDAPAALLALGATS